MKKLCLCLLIITFPFILSSAIKADTHSTFVTKGYYSKNRNFFVKVTPNKKATLYKGKQKIWTVFLPELPRDLLVTDNGKRVVMIENYYGNKNQGTKEVIIFFDEKGNKISSQTLSDVLADLKNVSLTTSGSHWLWKYKLNQEKHEVVVETVTLTCPLFNVSNEEDLRKFDECSRPKLAEQLVFSIIVGMLLNKTKIQPAQK